MLVVEAIGRTLLCTAGTAILLTSRGRVLLTTVSALRPTLLSWYTGGARMRQTRGVIQREREVLCIDAPFYRL